MSFAHHLKYREKLEFACVTTGIEKERERERERIPLLLSSIDRSFALSLSSTSHTLRSYPQKKKKISMLSLSPAVELFE